SDSAREQIISDFEAKQLRGVRSGVAVIVLWVVISFLTAGILLASCFEFDSGSEHTRNMRGYYFFSPRSGMKRSTAGSPANGPIFTCIAKAGGRRCVSVIRDEVYRIGREALINAFRHSQATNIELEVKVLFESAPRHHTRRRMWHRTSIVARRQRRALG